jgi:hypothetical protein
VADAVADGDRWWQTETATVRTNHFKYDIKRFQH